MTLEKLERLFNDAPSSEFRDLYAELFWSIFSHKGGGDK